ncbi:MAG: leucine-rich repeat domain-containing protein, partial [Candidatus Hydrogenedentota bacterium]
TDALRSLKNLRKLNLDNNNVLELSFLLSSPIIEELTLSNNRLVDITVLASLNHLKGLGLDVNNITDVSALASLSGLRVLGLTDNNIEDISPLVPKTLKDGKGTLILVGNPLSQESIDVHIPALKARGITVIF